MVDRGHIRIVLRAAARDEAPQIHRVLAEAFKPYRRDYTDQAYRATVVPAEEIGRRIDDPQTDVLVAVWGTDVVGTATVVPLDESSIYIKSMAVASGFQGKGIALELLKSIEQAARLRGYTRMVLDCYEPLTKAIALYERFGFRRTGERKPYHGIVVFEMAKAIEPPRS